MENVQIKTTFSLKVTYNTGSERYYDKTLNYKKKTYIYHTTSKIGTWQYDCGLTTEWGAKEEVCMLT